jgi:hypothetical protein
MKCHHFAASCATMMTPAFAAMALGPLEPDPAPGSSRQIFQHCDAVMPEIPRIQNTSQIIIVLPHFSHMTTEFCCLPQLHMADMATLPGCQIH